MMTIHPGTRLLALSGVLVTMGLPVAAQVIIDPIALQNVRAATCFAETFDGTNAAPYGAAVEGFHGQAVSTKSAKSGPTFSRDVVNPTAGTITWWARYDFAAIKTVPVFAMEGGLYINFFGKEGSTDPRHSNCLGHYVNAFGGAAFAAYPEGIPANTWMHFAFTWNGDQTLFYVNGNVSSVQTTSKPFSALPFRTFTLGGAGDYVFDELRVYNRTLSQTEIKATIAAARSDVAEIRRMALGLPERLASAKAVSLRATYRLSDHAVQVYSDLSAFGVSNQTDVLVIVRAPDKVPLITRPFTACDPGRLFHASIPADRPLSNGVYTVEVKVGAQTASTTFERVGDVWENNRIGITNRVIHPWTPMSARRETAVCWGREYTFGELGLPSQIRSTQPEPARGPATRDLLARPVRLVVVTAAGEVAWRRHRPGVRQRDESAVDVTANAVSRDGQFEASVRGTLEFDGFYKFTLALRGPTNTPVLSVRLEVPLPDALARLANATAEEMRRTKAFLDLDGLPDGELWNSINHGVKREILGNFYPNLWLGDEDRGIAFMADNYRGWALDLGKPCQDIVRRDGVTILRIHLLNRPGPLLRPIETTLSLQATPVRPRAAGGSWKAEEWYGWGYFDKAVLYHGCFDGIGTNGLAPEAWYRTDAARRDNQWWRYFCFQTYRTPFDDPDYGRTVQRYDDEWEAGLHVPSHSDYLMWAYKMWHDIASMDGIHYDNSFPPLARGLGSGLAWRDEDGRVHPSFNCFASRDFMKRVRTYFLQQGPPPVLKTHITDAPVVGYLGFCDYWMDGENGGYLTAEEEQQAAKGKAFDFVDRWYSRTGMANLRITLGRQWGAMPTYLYSWGFDATQAVLGLFDVDHNYWRMNGMTYEFGLAQADCDYIPYWDIRKPAVVTRGGPDVLTAVWKRPGRVRVQVSNLSPEDRTVEVNLGRKFLGLPADAVAVDEQTGESVAFHDGAITGLAVQRHNYRIVLLAAPGAFPPAPTATATVLPPSEKRLAPLCDDFAVLRPEWRIVPTHKPVEFLRGMARLDEVPHLVMRPFKEDNVSVQVKVRARHGVEGGDRGGFWEGGPSLFLCWSTNTHVQIVAGHENPMPNGPRIRAFAMAAGKAVPVGGQGPLEGTVAWLKLTLKPDVIAFFCSTDGQSWTTLGTLPRKGFEGAPAWLLLGNGCFGAKEFFNNPGRAGQAESFFAELIVSRE